MDSISTEVRQLFDNLVSGAIHLIPNLLLAIIVSVIGFLLARIFQKLIKRFMLYLNQKINKNLSSQHLSVDLLRSANFISKGTFWIIIFLTIV